MTMKCIADNTALVLIFTYRNVNSVMMLTAEQSEKVLIFTCRNVND